MEYILVIFIGVYKLNWLQKNDAFQMKVVIGLAKQVPNKEFTNWVEVELTSRFPPDYDGVV